MITVLGPGTAVGELVRESQRRGVEVKVVPGGPDKRRSLELFAEALDFPTWFGHNLDALADCLHYLAQEHRQPWHLVWDGVHALREEDEGAYAGIAGVLNEVAEEHDALRVTVIDR